LIIITNLLIFFFLDLPVVNKRNVLDSFNALVEEEILNGDNKIWIDKFMNKFVFSNF